MIQRLLIRLREEEIYQTHTPGPHNLPGQIVKSGGRSYRVTRRKPLASTRTVHGWSAACWSVRGVEVR